MFPGTRHIAIEQRGVLVTVTHPSASSPVEVPHLLSRVPLAVDGMPPHLFRSGGIPSVALVLGVRGPDQQQRLGASLCDQRDVALPMHFGPSPQSSDFTRPRAARGTKHTALPRTRHSGFLTASHGTLAMPREL